MKTMLEKFKALMIRLSGYLMLAFASAPMAMVAAEEKKSDMSGILSYDIDSGSLTDKNAPTSMSDGFKNMQSTGNIIYRGVVGLAIVIVMIIFVIKLIKLARSGDNPSERQKAIDSIITLLVAVALIGGAATITSWVWGALSGTIK